MEHSVKFQGFYSHEAEATKTVVDRLNYYYLCLLLGFL